jgi:hypothetical protein
MAEGGMSLEQQFINFSKFGDTKSDGRTITLTQIDKWLKQAQVIGKKITTTDTGICFNKFKSKTIDCSTFIKFLEDLASQKKIPVDELTEKLVTCGLPGTTKTTVRFNLKLLNLTKILILASGKRGRCRSFDGYISIHRYTQRTVR